MFVKGLLGVDDGDDEVVDVDYKVDYHLFDADECESPSLPNVQQLKMPPVSTLTCKLFLGKKTGREVLRRSCLRSKQPKLQAAATLIANWFLIMLK